MVWIEKLPLTMKGGVRSVKPTCFENSLTKGAPNSCNRETGHCLPCLTSWSGYISVEHRSNICKSDIPVTRGGLVVTVDLLIRRTVISNDVYEILDYVLKARMVSI
jgi:hypothetical protein